MPDSPTAPRQYAGRSAAERAAERRARLVAATVAVLGEQGEAAVTMTAVCARAGLTERYFYESFRGRDEALVAALDAVSDEVAAVALDAIASSDGAGAADRVRAGLAAVVDLVADDPAKGRVVVVESAANAALRARRHELLGTFATLVADEAARLYDLPTGSEGARLRGLVYVAGLAELVAAWLLGEVDLDRDGLVATGAELFGAVVQPR
ncbi:TetR family transcriptional regulator [Nocardioides perillae]|uniref:AcrR family transcriptional regulator n=1 Tax=Nocardioides perillae TaxID=1119534 RepID=A0A7Y9URL4_9ACTN|nr:AcrR family transcriptional regulator [Nocardioides perillae]